MNRNNRRANESSTRHPQVQTTPSHGEPSGIAILKNKSINIKAKNICGVATIPRVTAQSSAVQSGAVSDYTTSALFQFQADMVRHMASLEAKIDDISRRFSAMETAFFSEAPIVPREIVLRENVTDEQLISEIKQYFSDRDGELIYPSDVSNALNIEYELSVRLINEMEENGQIRAA